MTNIHINSKLKKEKQDRIQKPYGSYGRLCGFSLYITYNAIPCSKNRLIKTLSIGSPSFCASGLIKSI